MTTSLSRRVRTVLFASALATGVVVAPLGARPVEAASAQVSTSGATIHCWRMGGTIDITIVLPRSASNPAQDAYLFVGLQEGRPGGYPYTGTANPVSYPTLTQPSTPTGFHGRVWARLDNMQPTTIHTYRAPWNHPQRYYKATYWVVWSDAQVQTFNSNQLLC
jgi:hypothetical protein